MRDGSRDDAHAVVSVGRIRIEIDTSHCKSLPTAGLAIRQDCAVEALEKARDQRLRGRDEEVILGCLGRMNLVKSEVLLLGGGRGGRGRGRSGGGAEVDAGRKVDGDGICRSRMDDGALKASGNGSGVLVGGRADAQG